MFSETPFSVVKIPSRSSQSHSNPSSSSADVAAAQHQEKSTGSEFVHSPATGAAPSITAPCNSWRYRHLSRPANPMSSEASLFAHTRSHGSLLIEAHASSTGTERTAPAPCPPQLTEEAIASIPLELPPLDESCMSPAVVSAAEILRMEYAISSSQAKSSLLSLRKAWLRWHQLPMAPGLPGIHFVNVL
jgi:hypothetical protein